MHRFKLNVDVAFGDGALDALAEVCHKRVLLVTDSFMASHGVADEVASHLTDCEVTVFDAVVPEPPINVVAQGVKALEGACAEVMVALGGGSSIDAAKAIRSVYEESHEDAAHLPLYAVPTTSGTGSEVTAYAVITNPELGMKYPLASDDLLAEGAILDPTLTESVPPAITADTGLDALTHAIEAYVSTGANEFTDALAEHACQLIFEYLPRAFKDGSDLEARDKMSAASCMAGMAFSVAGLGVGHGTAHAIGARFHLPHGRACALTLPEVMKFNADLENVHMGEYSLAARKFQKLAGILGFSAAGTRLGAMNLIREVERLRATVKDPASLRDAGVDVEQAKGQLRELAKMAIADATTSTNPRDVTEQDAYEILERVLRG